MTDILDGFDDLTDRMADEQAQRLRAARLSTGPMTPEQAARANTISDQQGKPFGVVAANLDAYEEDQRLADVSAVGQRSPKVGEFLSDPRRMALAGNEAEALARFSSAYGEGFSYSAGLGKKPQAPGFSATPTNYLQELIGALVGGQRRGVAYLGEMVPDLSSERTKATEETVARGLGYGSRAEHDAARTGAYLADVESRAQGAEVSSAATQQQFEQLAQANETDSLLEAIGLVARSPRAIGTTVASSLGMGAPQLALTAATGGMGRLATAGTAGGGSAVVEYGASLSEAMSSEGIDTTDPYAVSTFLRDPEKMAAAKERAMKRGVAVGTFDALTAGLAGLFLNNARRGITSAALRTAAEGGMQVAGGMAGEASAQLATGEELQFGDILVEGVAELPFGAVETWSNYRTARNAGRVRWINERMDQIMRAADDNARLRTVTDAAGDIELGVRSPADMAAFVAQVAGEDAVVYLPADAAQTLFQSDELLDLVGSADELAEQMARGELAIPMSQWMTIVPRHANKEEIVRRARTDVDGMSAFDLDSVDMEELAREFGATEEAAERARPSEGDTRQRIVDDVMGQLIGTERFGQAEAETNAKVMAGFFETMGRLTGQDPFTLYQRYMAGVNDGRADGRPDPRASKPFTGSAYTDALIDSIRDPDGGPTAAQQFGPSLVDWLVGQGGLQDQGGELANMDAGRIRRGLVTANGLLPDRARELLAEAGYIPEGTGIDALFNAISDEFSGTPTYSEQEANAARQQFEAGRQELLSAIEDNPTLRDMPREQFAALTNQQIVDMLSGGTLLDQARPGSSPANPLPTSEMDTAPVGAWVRGFVPDSVGAFPNVFQVREVPIDQVTGVEFDSAGRLIENRQPDADRYAEAMREGQEFPNLHGYELEDGRVQITDGHRRLTAAQQAGRDTIRIAVMPADANMNFDQPAFHGTAAKVDRFTLQKIGTGTGDQNFGWGLYFASQKDIADFYRKDAAGIARNIPATIGDKALQDAGGDRGRAVASLTRKRDALPEAARGNTQAAIDWLRRGQDTGNLYQVEVPDSDVLLDWDKLLSEQPEAVRAAIQAHPEGRFIPEDATGKEIYDHFKALGESQNAESAAKAASEALFAAGIPGLQFADGEGKGTHNFVIWDEAAISEPTRLNQDGQQEQAGFDESAYRPEVVTWAKDRFGDVVAPNGNPAWQNFVAWFGDSKVVDEAGAPLVVYHGTVRDFDTFDSSAESRHIPLPGFYFTPDRSKSEMFAAPSYREGDVPARIVDANLSLQNPVEIDARSEAHGGRMPSERVIRETLEKGMAAGHDGAIIRGWADGSGAVQYVAFAPEQIKSATANAGNYSPDSGSILNQSGTGEGVESNPNFRRWSNDAPLVRAADAEGHEFKSGQKVVVEAFHGTKRPDRIGTRFRKGRATSGPMAFFTSDSEIASAYAQNKQDTSIDLEQFPFESWFKFKPKGSRSSVDIVRAWYLLDADQKAKIRELAPQVTQDDTAENIVVEAGNTTGLGNYDYELAASRTAYDRAGNPLKALLEGWLNGGTLYGDEQQFMKVLELAGFPVDQVTFDSPHAEFPAVYPVYLEMQRPLVTDDVPQEVADALNRAAKRDRSRPKYEHGADAWDKNTITLRDWVELFNEADNGMAWTSIPDKVTKLFSELGYDGIIDNGGKGGGERHKVYIPFDDAQVKSQFNRGTFDDSSNIMFQSEQPFYKAPRGQIEIFPDRRMAISLFEGADRSTFMHEAGHFFLEVYRDIAAQQDGPEQVKAGMDALVEWFRSDPTKRRADAAKIARGAFRPVRSGTEWVVTSPRGQKRVFAKEAQAGDFASAERAKLVAAVEAMSDAEIDALADQFRVGMEGDVGAVFGTVFHEQFARGWEKYLAEGKAPSEALQSVFSKFKAWILSVYKNLLKLDVELTDEVRGVMDRMLASEDEIAAAHARAAATPLAADQTAAAALGMDDQQFAEYRALVDRAAEDAKAEVLAKLVSSHDRETKAWWKEERAKVKAEVEAEVEAMPVYRAVRVLSGAANLPDGTPIPDEMRVRLDKQRLADVYGEVYLRRLKGLYLKKGGVSQDDAAMVLGFASGDDLVKALANRGDMRARIEAETDGRMRERYGDPFLDGQTPELAMAAIHGRSRLDLLDRELEILARRAGQPAPLRRAITAVARELIARKTPRKIKPNEYLTAERRAAREAAAAAARGDYAAALAAKRQQAFNATMYAESKKAQAEFESHATYLRRMSEKPAQARLGKAGQSYQDQVNQLLEQVEVRPVSGRQVDRRARLAEWVAEQERAGNAINVPQRLLDEAGLTNIRDMSLADLREVVSAIKQIAHLAKTKNRLTLAGQERDAEEVDQEMSGSVLAAYETRPERTGDPKRMDTIVRKTQELDIQRVMPSNIARELDGYEEGGAVWRNVILPIREAMYGKVMPETKKMQQALADLLRQHYSKAELRDMDAPVWREAVGDTWSRGRILSLAMNWGSAGNREAILSQARSRLTPDQVGTLLASLDARDYAFAQAVVDQINAYWPQIAETQRRRTGLVPEKVEPAPYTVVTSAGETVEFKGGYYPLKYDPERSGYGATQQEMDDAYNNLRVGKTASAATKNGHTKERVGSGGKTVMLGLDLASSHMRDVIRDLHMGDAVNYVSQVLHGKQFKDAVTATGKREYLKALDLWLKDVATGEMGARSGLEAAGAFIRQNLTAAVLTYKAGTAILQATGLFQTGAVLGKRQTLKGTAKLLSKSWLGPNSIWNDIREQSPFMAERFGQVPDAVMKVANARAGKLSAGWASLIRWGYVPMGRMQMIADGATWLAAKDKALRENGGDEAAAIAFADDSVIRLQAPETFIEKAAVSRGTLNENVRQTELVKTTTMLLTYMIAKGNVQREMWQKAGGNTGSFTGNLRGIAVSPRKAMGFGIGMIQLFVLETMFMDALRNGLPEDDDDDGWVLDDWLAYIAEEIALGTASTIPFVSQLATAGRGYDAQGPLEKAWSGVARSVATLWSNLDEDEELGREDVKAIINIAGISAGFPSSAVNTAGDALWRVHDGEDVSPIEFIIRPERPRDE